ncbi:MAG: hypothetical protein Fur0010_26730 [Bdellovibrio sp.]
MSRRIFIKKSSGVQEAFNESKLYKSMIRAGASAAVAKSVLNKVRQIVRPGMTTTQIRSAAYRQLKKESKRLAADYHLNRAIIELGPDGFVFEKFIAGLLRAKGYNVETNLIKHGTCIKHEIDIEASGYGKRIYIECKFHNAPEKTNDVKVALYVWARCLDLKNNRNNKFDEFWLVSNTKFSQDALDYANCVGLGIIGENAPNSHAISKMVADTGMHPLTCLSTLKKHQRVQLVREGKIFTNEILENPKILSRIGMSEHQIYRVISEIESLTHRYGGRS